MHIPAWQIGSAYFMQHTITQLIAPRSLQHYAGCNKQVQLHEGFTCVRLILNLEGLIAWEAHASTTP